MSFQDGDVPDQRKARAPEPIEWIVGGVSAALVAAMLGFLLVDGVLREDAPPVLTTTVESIDEMPRGTFRVAVRVANDGDLTAGSVEIEGEIRDAGDAEIETSSVTIAYVPAHSSAKATLLFDEDPRRHDLRVTPKGFGEP